MDHINVNHIKFEVSLHFLGIWPTVWHPKGMFSAPSDAVFWEGQKIWRNLPVLMILLGGAYAPLRPRPLPTCLLSNVKTQNKEGDFCGLLRKPQLYPNLFIKVTIFFFSVGTYFAQWANPEHIYHMVEETCNTKINNGNEMIENCIFHAKKWRKKLWKQRGIKVS